MAVMFSGAWTIDFPSATLNGTTLFNSFYNEHRFIIEGSSTRNGPHPFQSIVVPVSVSGPSWFFTLEWFDTMVGWRPNPVPLRRIGAVYTLQSGLVVTLQANNTLAGGGGIPFSTISLQCRNVEPQLNPWHPFTNPYDFRLPKGKRPRPEKPTRRTRRPD